MGEEDAAVRLERAVVEVIAEGEAVTDDLAVVGAGGVSTSEMTAALIARLA